MNLAALRACAKPASLLAVLLAVFLVAAAQQPAPRAAGLDPAKDPANLAGERVSAPALADTLPINHGAPALAQLLLKLRTRASLMLIVAHPDDEDGGMITYESRGQGARVAMLTLNRGEGGQNLMSGDFDDALGLIRTQELLAADRYMGVDQFFGSVVDFGFSKTREESLQKWGHDRVLYDAVRAVRLYRPLVLTSVFVGGVTDGHGQHQVSGEINQEVFTAAADPKVFPEMGLLPWAPMKVYARAPFARIDQQGMFDYATGKYSLARFFNYVTQKWSDTPPQAAVVVHEGEVSTALGMDGMSYVQFARKGLALQKSQNGGASRGGGGGAFDVGYARYGSRIPNSPATEKTLFDGIDITLPGIATLAPSASASLHGELVASLAKIDASTAEAQKLFDPAKPELTAPPLREALRTLDTLIAAVERSALDSTQKFDVLHELRIKRVQANNALVLALGVTLEPMVKPLHKDYSMPLTTSDGSIYANVRISNKGPDTLKIIRLNPEGDAEPAPAVKGQSLPPSGSLFAESNARYLKPPQPTRPYFSRPDIEQPYYDIADPALRNAPETPAPLVSSAIVDDQGVQIELRAVVPDAQSVMLRDAPADTIAMLKPGSLTPQPAVIVPPVSLKLGRSSGTTPFISKADVREYTNFKTAGSAGIIPIGTTTLQIGALLQVEAYKDTVPLGPARIGPDQISVALNAPPSWKVSAPAYNAAMEPVLEHFTVSPSPLKAGEQYRLTAKATLQGTAYAESYRPVGYPGIPYTNLYTPAVYRATVVDVHTAPDLKVAYLPGTGDDVPAYLPDLGVTPTMITLADLTAAKLAQYDAVVLGVRAYAAHPELGGAGSQPLIDYAKNGGVVIVQYNTSRYGEANAPFAISVPGSPDFNVVEETDPVTLLVPDSPVLTWPNRITSADFDHWVAERGHGFARSWAPEFQPLLETHDPGQDEERGGLLVARTGKGYYIYTALALYRQLPEGVPGAYRLFANLISLGKNPAK